MTLPATIAGRLRRFVPLVILLIGLITWADLFIRVIGPALRDQHFASSAYWVVPRLALEGRSHLLFSQQEFAEAAEAMGTHPDLGLIPNTPATVLPLLPFGLLPEAPAYFLWTVLSVACLLAAIALLSVELRPPMATALVVLAGLPLFHPLRANIATGQVYAFVLLAVVGAAVLGARRHADADKGAGIALGVVAVLKINYGLLLAVAPFLRRRRRMVAAAGIVFAVAAVLSMFIVDPGLWAEWLTSVVAWRSRPETTVSAYQTLHSLFGHLLRHEPTWNPSPVLNAPVLADALWIAAGATLGLTSMAAIMRTAGPSDSHIRALLPLAMLVPVAIIVSPIAEDHHYLLTLFPLLVGGAILAGEIQRRWAPWIAFTAALLLLGPAWPFNRQPVEGWWALLFYPRVYGALALWVLLLWLIRAGRPGHDRPA